MTASAAVFLEAIAIRTGYGAQRAKRYSFRSQRSRKRAGLAFAAHWWPPQTWMGNQLYKSIGPSLTTFIRWLSSINERAAQRILSYSMLDRIDQVPLASSTSFR